VSVLFEDTEVTMKITIAATLLAAASAFSVQPSQVRCLTIVDGLGPIEEVSDSL
jgi:hypothetical protein